MMNIEGVEFVSEFRCFVIYSAFLHSQLQEGHIESSSLLN